MSTPRSAKDGYTEILRLAGGLRTPLRTRRRKRECCTTLAELRFARRKSRDLSYLSRACDEQLVIEVRKCKVLKEGEEDEDREDREREDQEGQSSLEGELS